MPSKSEPSRRIGSGTTDDPMIIWVRPPPDDEDHKSKIEGIARELGQRGKTHIWLRSWEHSSARKRVWVRRGRSYWKIVPTDNHITIYSGESPEPTEQCHVYIVIEEEGNWRIMEDSERMDNGGLGVETWSFSRERQGWKYSIGP